MARDKGWVEFLVDVLDDSTDTFAAVDKAFRIVAVSAAYAREFSGVFGRALAPGADLVEASAHAPPEAAALVEGFRTAVRGRYCHTELALANGSRTRRTYRFKSSPVVDDSGAVIGAVQLGHAVAGAARAGDGLREQTAELEWQTADRAAALKDSEDQLRAVVETALDGIITIDERGMMCSANPAAERMFGYRAEEMVGRNVSMLMPSPDRERHDGYLQHYLETGEKRIIGIGRVVSGQRRNGAIFPLDLSVAEAHAGDSRIFVGYVRDLTDRQRAERQLQELQSELSHLGRVASIGHMTSAVAHEVRQPLTAVTNYLVAASRLLEKGGEENLKRVAEVLGKARAQALRTSDVMESMRSFAKHEDVEREPASLNAAVEEACVLALLGAEEIEFRLELDPALEPFPMHKLQIQQVVVNLVQNAVDAVSGSERREVCVRTGRDDDGMALILIADTGPGLSQSVLGRLFQPFVTTKRAGLGLGLSICRTIAEAHGGRIEAAAGPEGGTIMRVMLPLAS